MNANREGTRAPGHGGTREPVKARSGLLGPACPGAHLRSISTTVLALATVLPAQAPAAPDATLERVEVVGSRIKRVEVETAQPVLVIERAQLEATGLMAVGDILQDLTVHGAALNSNVNNGGDGTTRVDLRNLGERRTLVLVDGRRWIPGIDGGVDLNSIPLAMVERIEVLKDGASAIYGSDAIAGVINISTRETADGLATRTYIGESAHGDGRVESVEASHGWTGERTRASLGLSWQRQAEIFAGDREISEVPTFGLPGNDVAAGASPFTENGLYGFGLRGACPYNPAGSYPANGRCSAADGRPPIFNRSIFDPATGGYRLFDARRDGYNFAPDNFLATPQQRRAVFANLGHDFDGGTRLTLQLLANERASSQQLAPSPLMLGVLSGGVANLSVPADHVYNPFGQPVTGLALRPGGQNRRFTQDADTTRIALGLDGVLSAFGRAWFWDLDLVHARYRVDETTAGLADLTRLRQALGPSFRDASGSARCGTPAAPVAGCVPFDAFRGPAGYTPEMIDYVYYRGRDLTQTRSRNYRLGVSSDLIDLPAGPLALAAGFEYRRERGESRIDARRAALDNLVGQDYGGAVRAAEGYVELAIPLLAQAPHAHALDLSLAGRHSDYDSFGRNSSFEGGVRWAPLEDLMLRASFAEGFRAPIVSELYFPRAVSFGGIDFDPCVNPNALQRVNCAADGVPGGRYDPERLGFDVLTGGNPELQPESSESITAGVVWSPAGVPGFDLSLDGFRIEVEDALTGVSPEQLLAACYTAGVAEACARTTRDARGELLQLDSRDLNSGTLRVQGFDLGLGYRLESGFGRFELRFDASYTQEYRAEVPRGNAADLVGQLYFLEPGFRVRANLDLGWERGPWSAGAGLRHYSALDEPCVTAARAGRAELCSNPGSISPVNGAPDENRLGSRTYVDLRAGWQSPWKARFNLGVHNAFDRDPPVSYSGTANSFDAAYPLPGRFYYLDATLRF